MHHLENIKEALKNAHYEEITGINPDNLNIVCRCRCHTNPDEVKHCVPCC